MTNSMKRGVAALVSLALMIAALYVYRQPSGRSQMVYTAAGYGGFVAAEHQQASAPKPVEKTRSAETRTTGGEGKAASPEVKDSPVTPAAGIDTDEALQPAKDAYRGGDFKLAGLVAREVVGDLAHSSKPAYRQAAVEARDIEAYADARQKKFSEARQEFAVVQSDARGADGGRRTEDGGEGAGRGARGAGLDSADEGRRTQDGGEGAGGGARGARLDSADGGRRTQDGETRAVIDPAVLGEPAVGRERLREIEQDAGYQHAVLTAALGKKTEAEREYLSFMKRYPESPLAAAALKRVEQMHGGNLPPEAAAVWRQTTAMAAKEQKQQELANSMCGPECLAELLRREDGGGGAGREAEGTGYGSPSRSGKGSGDKSEAERIKQLAQEMGTSDRGTSMEAMLTAAKERGLGLRGVQLSWRGLTEQKLPAIGLVAPGHYVLIEQVDSRSVTVWDPDSEGGGQPGRRVYTREQWQRIWGRVALVAG